MAEINVPKNSLKNNSYGSMIIEQENNSMNEISNQENIQNINPQVINNNSINSKTFPSSIKTKIRNKNSSKLKGDSSHSIKCKIKNSLSLKNATKTHKNKNKFENENSKKLSNKHKINQSNTSFNESSKEEIKIIKSQTNLSSINEIIDKELENEMNQANLSNINEIMDMEKEMIHEIKNENDNNILMNNEINNNISNNENIIKNNIVNNEINFEYINVKNNSKEIINPPLKLTFITYEEFNQSLPAFEYLNDIWESFIEKEKFNKYSYNDIISIQTDIKEPMRCILIDWIISLQNKFFYKSNTLFLTINLIDRYLSKKSILRTKFQLLGVTSLFISYKYEEIYMKNINDFVELTARAFDKSEILEMEKIIIDLVEFNLDLPLSKDFFDLLSTVYKFNENEYAFGSFLLEAFLLDMTSCEYKQSQIALATCFIILRLRQMKNIIIEGNDFIKYYCNEYKVNFDIWKEYDIIVNCAKKIYFFFEQSDKVIYKEVYKLFNYLFI
jgi:hypothetical protein